MCVCVCVCVCVVEVLPLGKKHVFVRVFTLFSPSISISIVFILGTREEEEKLLQISRTQVIHVYQEALLNKRIILNYLNYIIPLFQMTIILR